MGTDLTNDLPEIARCPVLQAAIDGLDVSLGDELERYRLWRERGNSITTIRPSARIKTSYNKVDKKVDKVDAVNTAPSADAQALPSSISQSATYRDIDLTSPPSAVPEPVNDKSVDAQVDPQPSASALVKPPAETATTASTPPLDTNLEAELDDSLEAWTASYQQEMRPPDAPTRLEVPEKPTPAEPKVEEEEEDVSIGIAGIVSIGLIAFSVVAISFLLLDPFGWLRTQRNTPPTPAPSSALPLTESPQPPLIDRELLSAQPNPIPPVPVTPTPALPEPLPAEIPSQVIVPVPAPAPPRSRVVKSQPSQPPTPSPVPEVTTPVEPVPTPAVTIAPVPPEGGNFAVVTDPSYANYVQPIVQPVIRPSDGKLQLGAYGDAETANQKAEEWRRYGVPATVVPR
jgi:hypothetical protein